MPKILVCDEIAQQGLDILHQAGEVEVKIKQSQDQLLVMVGDFDALVVRSETKITAPILAAGKNLKIVGRAGVGVDNIDVPAATAHHIIVVNSPGGNTLAAAELAFGLMFALARHIPQAHTSLKKGEWKRSQFMGSLVIGKTLGLIGVGRIGSEMASRARACGMRVLGYDPVIAEAHLEALGIESCGLDELLGQSDYVSLHAPLNANTRQMMNAETLAKMKKGAHLVNTARGGLIDELALYEALESGHLAGAALDVYEKEPPENCKLLELDKVIATPHLGASAREAQVQVAVDVAEQIVEVLQGGKPRSAVNFPFES